MNKCSQTKISRGFSLIIDDSDHLKKCKAKDAPPPGNFTAEVGRQDIGEIGKTDNGIVVLTTYLYDGRKSLPDIDRFFDWLTIHRDVFAANIASLGYIWA